MQKVKSRYTGMLQAAKTIVKEESVLGLWRGTLPGQLLTIPYCAVQFVALQKCKELVHSIGWDQGRSASAASFATGAFAGMMATAASYPFDLLRTTMAAQGEPKVYKDMFAAAKGKLCTRSGMINAIVMCTESQHRRIWMPSLPTGKLSTRARKGGLAFLLQESCRTTALAGFTEGWGSLYWRLRPMRLSR